MARKAQSKSETPLDKVKASEPAAEQLETSATESTKAPEEQTFISLSACGGALRAAREKQKLSVQEVASQLRLGVKQVEALETDRFDKLPEPSIVRGFMRNYAKLLKIDASPIIEAYAAMVPNITPKSFAVKSNANASVIGENRPSFSFTSFIGLFLFFALVVWFFYYYTQVIKPNVASDLSNINAPVAETDATAGNTEFALPAAERQAEALTPIELPAQEANPNSPSSIAVDGSAPVTTDASPAVQTPPVAAPTSADSTAITLPAVKPSITPAPAALPAPVDLTPTQPATAETKTSQLVIDATEETWVNITDNSGKQVYSKVIAAGTSETVTALPPLSITVGNAQATSISVNGKPLDLSAHTRDRVARIKVN